MSKKWGPLIEADVRQSRIIIRRVSSTSNMEPKPPRKVGDGTGVQGRSRGFKVVYGRAGKDGFVVRGTRIWAADTRCVKETDNSM